MNNHAENLIKILEQHRLHISEVPKTIWDINFSRDESDIKGKISEQFVQYWFKKIKEVQFLNENNKINENKYSITYEHHNIKVYNKTMQHQISEFDSVIFFNDKPFIVEVKSQKLRGFESKIEKYIHIGRELFNTEDIGLLLFAPFYSSKVKDLERIENQHENVKCIDLGYKKKQFNRLIKSIQ